MNRTGLRFAASLCTSVLSVAILSSCTQNESFVTQTETARDAATGESWTVMVYMSGGSDEYAYGTASNTLKELTEVNYPENLNVLVQTGGSYGWKAQGIDSNYMDRFIAQKDNLCLLERTEQENMAKQGTLTDYIDWCVDTYPAQHYALIIYGSGSNSAYGYAHDELYENDSLTLNELSKALNNSGTHLDMIGFDSDLSATAEAASMLSTSADYLIASQEYMAEGGWNYAGWFNYIKENPTSSIEDIAKAACDTYMAKCKKEGTSDMATMSVTSLSEITSLTQAIEGMSGELNSTPNSLADYSEFSNGIINTITFGANTPDEGYSNMLDINDMAVQIGSAADKTSGRVQEELQKAVIYNVSGKYRNNASGLSIFYPINQSSDELPRYLEFCPFKRYAEFITATSANAGTGNSTTRKFSDTSAYKDYVTERDRMTQKTVAGDTGLELNMEGNMEIVRRVQQRIFQKSDSGYLYLGNAFETDEQKEAGIYKTKNNFTFPLMNGHSISLNVVYDCESYAIYSVPLKVDGAVKNLRIAAVKKDDGTRKYKPLGLYDSLGAGSKYSRHITPLRIYNLVTPLYKEYSTEETVEGESFKTWPIGLHIQEKGLPDGDYKTDFEIEYIYGNSFNSGAADFGFYDNTISYK